jgi:hypothetical protein
MGGKNYFYVWYIIFFRKGANTRDRHIAQFRSLGP